MTTQSVNIGGINISIPVYYQAVKAMPGDPENSKPYIVQTQDATCFLVMHLLGKEQAMPMDEQMVIDGIHNILSPKQGLIEVKKGPNYIYSIVKDLQEKKGVQYVLVFQKFFGDQVLSIHGYFDERGAFGVRDSMVYEICKREHIIGGEENPLEGWAKDPYDPDFKRGILMNLSEAEKYDSLFPKSPLSMCREFLRVIMEEDE